VPTRGEPPSLVLSPTADGTASELRPIKRPRRRRSLIGGQAPLKSTPSGISAASTSLDQPDRAIQAQLRLASGASRHFRRLALPRLRVERGLRRLALPRLRVERGFRRLALPRSRVERGLRRLALPRLRVERGLRRLALPRLRVERGLRRLALPRLRVERGFRHLALHQFRSERGFRRLAPPRFAHSETSCRRRALPALHQPAAKGRPGSIALRSDRASSITTPAPRGPPTPHRTTQPRPLRMPPPARASISLITT
jgi:hypothetical protein